MANTKKYVSLDKLSLYDEKIKKVVSDGDAAALASAKSYADGLAVNYDAAGSANTALESAKTYTDGQISTVNTTIAGVKTTAEQGVSDAAAAKSAADAAQGDVDALEAYVGTFTASEGVDTVVKYIDAKTAHIASDETVTAIADRVGVVEGKVATIEGDYLKSSDKTELQGKIDAKADKTALDEVSAVANAAVKQSDYDTKVAALEAEDARIEGLVTAEAERAANAESGLEDRIETMEAFWAAAQADGTDSNVIDTLKEIQDYIAGDETGAANMLAAIEANEKAIEDMDAAYKAADATLQGNIDKKVDISVVEALDGRVDALETASATYATKDEVQTVSDSLTEYKDAHKDDYTNAQIDAAIKVNTDAIAALDDVYATDAELAAAIEGVKADSSNKDAVVLAEAQKGIDAVQLALDTHTGNGDIHVTAEQKATWTTAAGKAHEHSNLSVLEGITSAKVTAWDNAEGNAKGYADGLNTTMNGRVEALETWHNNFTEVSEEEINALFA